VPIPSYLLALAVGKLVAQDIGPRSRVWSEASMVAAGAYEFGETEAYLAAGEAVAGEYVWGRYDILLLPPSFPYGASLSNSPASPPRGRGSLPVQYGRRMGRYMVIRRRPRFGVVGHAFPRHESALGLASVPWHEGTVWQRQQRFVSHLLLVPEASAGLLKGSVGVCRMPQAVWRTRALHS
jgi:hypothetical protein